MLIHLHCKLVHNNYVGYDEKNSFMKTGVIQQGSRKNVLFADEASPPDLPSDRTVIATEMKQRVSLA